MSGSSSSRRSSRARAASRSDSTDSSSTVSSPAAPFPPASTSADPAANSNFESPSSSRPCPAVQYPPHAEEILSASEPLVFAIEWDVIDGEIVEGDGVPEAAANWPIPAASSSFGSSSAYNSHGAHLSAMVFPPNSPIKNAKQQMHENSTVAVDRVKARIRTALPTRWLVRHCTVTPEKKRDALIEAIMSSATMKSAIDKVLKTVAAGTIEPTLAPLVKDLGNEFRGQLLARRALPDNGYGKLVSRGDLRIGNPDPTDLETNRADIIVQKCNLPDGLDAYDWTMLNSFIGVKRFDRHDGKQPLAVQGVQYARKLLQYNALTSHTHFLTWCGCIARLWYIDSAHIGWSEAFSLADDQARLAIGRFLCLLTSEECRGVLSGRWNPSTDPPVHIADSEEIVEWQEGPSDIYVRSWPFGSRTAIWTGRTREMVKDVAKRGYLILKCSWQPEHLLDHELKMQLCIQHIEGSPRPLGRITIPDHVIVAGFKMKTAQQSKPIVRGGKSGLHLCALLFEHRIGRPVDPKVRMSTLSKLHRQLVDTLLCYAKEDLHYRDLNMGNMLIEVDSEDVLVLADHGNMRSLLRPRGTDLQGELDVVLERAEDDARSANQLFLPTGHYRILPQLNVLKAAMDSLKDEEAKVLGRPLSACTRSRMTELAVNTLGAMRRQLIQVVKYSHRYVDDLESAQYLHMFQVAQREGIDSKAKNEVARFLNNILEKTAAWHDEGHWFDVLLAMFAKMQEWREVMCSLHREILSAQVSWRSRVDIWFNANIDEQTLREYAGQILERGDSVKASDAVVAAFNSTRSLLWAEQLQDIEKDCFERCAVLLNTAAEALGRAEGAQPREAH